MTWLVIFFLVKKKGYKRKRLRKAQVTWKKPVSAKHEQCIWEGKTSGEIANAAEDADSSSRWMSQGRF